MYSNQSVSVPEVLDAIQALIMAATGLNERQVIEWHFNSRSNLDQGGSCIWFKLVDRSPDTEAGSGRHGTKAPMVVEICHTTRSFGDSTQKDKIIGRKHWIRQSLLENSFYGQMLFDEYLPWEDGVIATPARTTGFVSSEAEARRIREPDSTPGILTIGTMVSAKLPPPDKPRPEQGYMETRIGVLIPVVLELSLDSVPEIEE